MDENNQVLVWLIQNKEFIKMAAICKKVGIKEANFSKYAKSGYLPKKYIEPIAKIISRFGFVGSGVDLKVPIPIIQTTVPDQKQTVLVQTPSAQVNTPKIKPKVPFEKEKWFFAEKYTLYPAASKPLIQALTPKWKYEKNRSDAEIKKAWEMFQEEG